MNIKLKSLFVRTFAGGFIQQLLCATCIFIAVLLLAIGIRIACAGEYHDVVNRVLVEMISPVPYANDVFTAANNPGYTAHGGMFWVYLLGSIVFSGLVIAIITNFLRSVGERYKAGKIRYRVSRHIVVLGYNKATIGLLQHLLQLYPHTTILLQITGNVPAAYEQLSVALTPSQLKRVLPVHADRNSPLQLEHHLRVHLADRIYLIGDDDEPNHDARNLDTILSIALICQKHHNTRPIPCSIELDSESTFLLFQTNDWPQPVKQYLHAYPYNYYTNHAHKLWAWPAGTAGQIQYPPLDNDGIHLQDDATVHLLIAGFTPMGMALATEAAHIAHYPNYTRNHNLRTRITIIDEQATDKATLFMSKYAPLFELSHWSLSKTTPDACTTITTHTPMADNDFIDIEWEFIEGHMADSHVQNIIKTSANNPLRYLTIACCLQHVQSNIDIGYYMPREVYACPHNTVLVYQPYSCQAIMELQAGKYKNVYPFGMTCMGYEDDTRILLMAQCVNWCYNHMDHTDDLPHLTPADVAEPWDQLPVSKKFSNIYHALSIPAKLRSMDTDYHASMSETEHNRWNVEELLLQFRPATAEEAATLQAQGTTKNINAGIHTCIVPYHMLSPDMQAHDETIVKASNNIQNTVNTWITNPGK